MHLRPEQSADYRAAEELTRAAFWNHHVPGCVEHYLLHHMRAHPGFLPQLTFVAEEENRLVGHIAYSIASISGEKENWPVLCFGPLSVLPEYQGRGIGSALVRRTVDLAKGQGYAAICITGHPGFYGRLGFRCAERHDIRYSNGKFLPALMALELIPGALSDKEGCFQEPEAMAVDMAGFDTYDAAFPYREKVSGTRSQLEFEVISGIMYG